MGEIILAARILHKEKSRGWTERREEQWRREETPPLLEPDEEDGLAATPSAMSHQELQELYFHLSI